MSPGAHKPPDRKPEWLFGLLLGVCAYLAVDFIGQRDGATDDVESTVREVLTLSFDPVREDIQEIKQQQRDTLQRLRAISSAEVVLDQRIRRLEEWLERINDELNELQNQE